MLAPGSCGCISIRPQISSTLRTFCHFLVEYFCFLVRISALFVAASFDHSVLQILSPFGAFEKFGLLFHCVFCGTSIQCGDLKNETAYFLLTHIWILATVDFIEPLFCTGLQIGRYLVEDLCVAGCIVVRAFKVGCGGWTFWETSFDLLFALWTINSERSWSSICWFYDLFFALWTINSECSWSSICWFYDLFFALWTINS